MAEHKEEIVTDFRQFYGLNALRIEDYEEALILLRSLLKRSDSNYFASKNFWDYPLSRTEMLLWDLLDITISMNWDRKKNGVPYKPGKRPYSKQKNQITKNIIDFRRAKSVYTFKKTTKTEEEIRELNRKFIEKQRKNK